MGWAQGTQHFCDDCRRGPGGGGFPGRACSCGPHGPEGLGVRAGHVRPRGWWYRQAGPLGAAPSHPGPEPRPQEEPHQPHTPSLLPAGTRQVWWAWPPVASRQQWKALSPAPCPCPTACPLCPTRPTPLLLARPSSPRQIETTRATSCSPGGARAGRCPRTGVCRGGACGGRGAPETVQAPGGQRWRRPPHISRSRPVPRASRCPVSFASSLSRRS